MTAGVVGSAASTSTPTPEVVLPAGVEPAVSAQHPISCYSDDITTGARTEVTPAQGCGQAPAQGFHGLQLTNTSRNDGLWPLPAGKAIDILVPAALHASAGRRAAAEPRLRAPGANGGGRPPCRPDQAGDNLQIGVWVVDGHGDPWLAPQIGLQVAAAPAGAVAGTTTTAPAPAPGPTAAPSPGAPAAGASAARLLTAPRSLRIRTALRGIRATVAVPAGRARHSHAERTAARAPGRRAPQRGARRLPAPAREADPHGRPAAARARTVTATLRVTVRVPGRPAASATSRIRLRR